MRTFIAIDLSKENRQKLAELQSELKTSGADVKWVEPDNVHLTLKFLGEISEQQAAQVKVVMDKLAPQFKPYEIALSGIGAFPKLDYPRVVWVGIENERGETKEIAEKIDEELSKLGFQKEEREFSPHLTIGRVRSPKNKEQLKAIIQTLHLIPNTLHLQRVDHISLYQSTLTPQGPIYTCLHKAEIKPHT